MESPDLIMLPHLPTSVPLYYWSFSVSTGSNIIIHKGHLDHLIPWNPKTITHMKKKKLLQAAIK
jgi:hypothetical protein